MKWKISWLESLENQELKVKEKIIFDKKMFNKVSNINRVDPIDVEGVIFIKDSVVCVDLNFNGKMFLPCILSNEEGEYVFNFNINNEIDDSYNEAINYEKDYIDLYELIWQHLIIEAPSRYVKDNSIIKQGKSWQYINEDEYLNKKSNDIDPRLEILKNIVIDNKGGE